MTSGTGPAHSLPGAACRACLALLLMLAAGPAAADGARHHGGWSMTFYAAGDIGCAAIDRALALPDDRWRPAQGLAMPRGAGGRTLWLRLQQQAPVEQVRLVVRWEHNATLSDWRDISRRNTEHARGHAPGFTVVELPDARREPLLLCLVAPVPRTEAFQLLSPAQLQDAENTVVAWMALLAGVILAMSAMALVFFARLRAPVFAAYGIYSLCLLGYLLAEAGALAAMLPAGLRGGSFPYALRVALITATAAAGVRFTVLFSRADADWPRTARWLRHLSVLLLASVLPILASLPPFRAGFAVQVAGVVVQNIAIGASILLLMTLVGISASRGRREARIYLFGWLPQVALLLLTVLVMLGLLPSSLRPSPLWTMGAAAFASLVLGWGLVDRSQRDRIERDEAIARAGTDPLTGTRSRAALRPALDAAGSDPAAPAVLLYLDLDHFKQVNDRHGHAAGDRCLQRFAQRCRDQLRGVDVLARQGGEEFIALLPGSTLADGLLVAERIRAAVAADTRAGPSTTVSIGAAQRLPGEPVNEWMSRADAALYRAKSGGRNRVEAA